MNGYPSHNCGGVCSDLTDQTSSCESAKSESLLLESSMSIGRGSKNWSCLENLMVGSELSLLTIGVIFCIAGPRIYLLVR